MAFMKHRIPQPILKATSRIENPDFVQTRMG